MATDAGLSFSTEVVPSWGTATNLSMTSCAMPAAP
jgi:hypothetical protein